MPITPISLVTLVMLGDDRSSLDFTEIHDLVRPFAAEAADRDLPSTTTEPLDDRAVVGRAIDELVVHGIVNRVVDGDVIRYGIAPESQLAAAYYRNMVIHFFVDGAVAELALAGTDGDEPKPVAAVFAEARRIREVLLFEFFFAGRDDYDAVIAAEIERRSPGWRDLVAAGEVASVLGGFRPFRSPGVLRPFLEAYRVVADLIEEDAYMGTIDQSTLVDRALRAGREQLAAGTITSGQSVSKILFEDAVTLARHRGMFEPGPDVVERRKAFAAEIAELAARTAMG
jgi:glycerol-3-phosphate O-acyltransferase